jgi:Flp pilus assembly protein TadG
MSETCHRPAKLPALASASWRLFGRFLRSGEGVTAIETALVAPVFILFVAGVAEVSAMLITMRMLDNATESAARLVRMGDATLRSGSAAAFKDAVCSGLPSFASCAENLTIKMVAAEALGDLGSQLASTPASVASPAFNPGLPSGFVAVEAKLEWGSFSPMFSKLTPTLVTFISRTAFRNEPFPPSQTGVGM